MEGMRGLVGEAVRAGEAWIGGVPAADAGGGVPQRWDGAACAEDGRWWALESTGAAAQEFGVLVLASHGGVLSDAGGAISRS